MTKPTVNYDETKAFSNVVVGLPAFVCPINHPNPNGTVSNNKMVRTSPVVKVWDDAPSGPVFETANTIYAPMEK